MSAVVNISWHGGKPVLGTVGSDDHTTGTVAETFSAVLRDSEGVNLVFNDDIGAAEKLTIPAGAEIGRVVVISGTLYAVSGDSGDTNIAAGGGLAYTAGMESAIPIGFNDDGTRHDTLLVVGV